jgi:hypothetical protein
LNLRILAVGAALICIAVGGEGFCQQRYWVYFRDKGCTTPEEIRTALAREESRLSSAARERLRKVRPEAHLLSEADLPVCTGYLREIRALTGLEPHAVVRSINAASYAFDVEQRACVERLPFVLKTAPVRRFARDPEPDAGSRPARSLRDADTLNYGDSFTQNALENFPPAHDAGYDGRGVLVGMLDAGWNLLEHRCFETLDIVATWDFVNGDSSVANDPGQMGEGSHGTKTLSCLAGYDPGYLIGAAYGISIALAKTENTEYELPIEEDNWAAGIEWLDSLGCVIATSSLSYPSLHSYEELDGNTTVITIAADNAVARGIVVLNSAGNRGNYTYPNNKMGPPSDGDSVLAIGSVNADSMRSSFSSLGPTYDGRIKPDLMAMGNAVTTASSVNPEGYTVASGTSFSTPITAGACALLLQADPALTPMQVHAFLKATGTQAHNPDTLNGWGIYDVWRAIQAVIAGVSPDIPTEMPRGFQIMAVYPNPFNPQTVIQFTLPAAGEARLRVFDASGRSLRGVERRFFTAGEQRWVWDAGDFSSGVYWLRLETDWGGQIRKVILLK